MGTRSTCCTKLEPEEYIKAARRERQSLTEAKFGMEVAEKGERNKEIVKKSLETNSVAYAYASMEMCIRIH
ncbi:hypothetical protein PIB30_044610 [Stylosanthes scabra]|uniref:Uncharacterized protein n=1 Tax=Stylosanthes scabra TaxID=79078 RepID=A0ABU6SG28_9FABA|nr:hypothetical protein [Stylosanthes scabra]